MANMTITEILTGIRDWVNGFHIEGKATKVGNATNGNFAALNGSGDLTDSGKKASDFAQAGDMTTVQGKVATIEGKIPSEASSSNQLVDKNYLASQIANFITRSVNDLANYYLKSETYTKTEVQALIAAINQFHYEVYPSTSAVTSPANNVLYLIGPTGQGSDKYEEYVYPNSTTGWVKIGDTSIDLSGYVTTTALDTALANYTTTTDLTTLLTAKEAVANKVTSLSDESTDEQYPSAKAVYDALTSDNSEIQTLAKLCIQQQTLIEGLQRMIYENMGDVKVKTVDSEEIPKVCGNPLIIVENSAPTIPPRKIGQIHVNTSTSPSTIKVAYRVTGSTNDWK